MQSATRIAGRVALVAMVVWGLMALAAHPAAAREICNLNGSLGLADGNGDGVVSRGEIQAIIDAAQGVEGVDQLQSLLNSLPGDVTGIRYTGCTPGGDAGSGDGGSGTGTDGGTGTGTDGGTGTGTDGETDPGPDGVAGTDDDVAPGVDGALGTDDDVAASAGEGEVVINAEGTPVNSVTGLPDTGLGSAGTNSGASGAGLALAVAGAIAVAGGIAISLRNRLLTRA